MALAAEPTEHEALSLKAAPLFQIGEFSVTNSMLVSWIVALAMILFAQIATRNIKTVPTGVQNFWEWMVESLYNFLEGMIGRQLVQKTFWFFATIFIFILFLNWFGTDPRRRNRGLGASRPGDRRFPFDRPLLRGANADLNLTFAMAVVFFVLWIVWALQANGFGGFLMHLFGPKGELQRHPENPHDRRLLSWSAGWRSSPFLFRPISLSFRLFGNIYAGENMLEVDVAHGAGACLADPDSVLLYGTPGGLRAGAGLYVIDRCLYALDRAT